MDVPPGPQGSYPVYLLLAWNRAQAQIPSRGQAHTCGWLSSRGGPPTDPSVGTAETSQGHNVLALALLLVPSL